MAIFRGVGGSGDSSDNSFLDGVTAQAQAAEASATAAANSATSALNTELTSASFNTSNGVLTLTKQDGDTVTTDLDGRFLLTESNDLSSSVTWANVPNANITQSSVTQHQAALSITESQISDLQSYLTSYTETDPVFSAHAASGVTATKINNWDTAYNNKITAVDYTGSTLTLTQQDGGTLTTTINGALGTSLVYNGATKAEAVATGLDVTGDISLGDNGKAKFGAGNDLQIYHDGSNSYIHDAGIGNLIVRADQFDLKTSDSTEYKIRAITDGAVSLYHDGGVKLATTSTGIDVTGTVTASDGFAMGSGDQISSTGNMFIDIDSNNDSTAATLDLTRDGKTKKTARFAENGDISFYEDTGTTAKLFWDASTERLGIGTSNPSYTLDVNSGTTNDTVRFKSSDDTVTIVLEDDDTVNEIESSAVGIRFDLSGSEKMRIQSDGNVGIGTINPRSTLHVTNSGATTATHTDFTGIGLTITGADSASDGDFGGGLAFTRGATKRGQISLVQVGTDTDAQGLAFFTHPSSAYANDLEEAMRIGANGNVGIGTNSPTDELEIRGAQFNTTQVSIGDNTDRLRLGYIHSNALESSTAAGQLATTSGADLLIAAPSNNASTIRLHTNSANGAPSERMRIDSSGNVGIGTTSPNEPLTVSGNTLTYGSTGNVGSGVSLFLGNNSNSRDIALTRVASGSLGIGRYSGGWQETARFDSSGNVGIGTSSPDARLHVKDGDVRVEHTRPRIYLTDTNNNSDYSIINNNGDFSIYDDTNTAYRMYINSSGNVGIGTTNAAKTLTVEGTGLRVQSTASADFYSTGQDALIVNNGTANLRLWNNGSERMRIDSSGNVGIGESSPTQSKLVVNSGTEDGIATFKSTDALGYISIQDNTTTSLVGAGATGDDLLLFSNNLERVRVDSTGNVGIGTTSPTTKLDVNGSLKASGLTYPTSDGTANQVMVTDGSGNLSFATASGGSSIWTETTNDIYYNGSKQIGIGTSSPSAALEVEIDSTESQNYDAFTVKCARTGYPYFASLENTNSDGTKAGSMIHLSNAASGVTGNPQAIRGLIGLSANGGGYGQYSAPFMACQPYAQSGNGIGIALVYAGSATHFATGLIPCDNTGTGVSGTYNLGTGSVKWSTVYATTGTISTSDITEKQDIEELNEAERRVALAAKGLLRKYRWKSSVAEKGDDARIHFGIMAQDLQAAFEAEGLDSTRYAMFCSDTYYECDGYTYGLERDAPENAVQVTKLGVRYSDLLAFIIAVI